MAKVEGGEREEPEREGWREGTEKMSNPISRNIIAYMYIHVIHV